MINPTPMALPKLPNYLRTYRKRFGLSQAEVAFLLGCGSGSHVCRYERFARLPTLLRAFAFGVVFKSSTNVLFAGAFRAVQADVRRRAKRLATRLASRKSGQRNARKLELLRTIVSSDAAQL